MRFASRSWCHSAAGTGPAYSGAFLNTDTIRSWCMCVNICETVGFPLPHSGVESVDRYESEQVEQNSTMPIP